MKHKTEDIIQNMKEFRMNEINSILNKNEKPIWEGKPKFTPYFLNGAIQMVVVTVVFYVLLLSLLYIMFPYSLEFLYFYVLPTSPLFLILLLILKIQDYRKRYYMITNRRIIVQSGIVGRDFKIVDYDKFSNALVNVGFFDKIFGTGTIDIIGNINLRFSNITNPYDVFKHFKKISFDVKTDIYFPNKYRPKENPGYRTRYNPK